MATGNVASKDLRLASVRDPASTKSPEDPIESVWHSSVESASRYEEGDLIAGKYRLGRKLGEGGMGTVWIAENEALGARVALKLISGNNHSKTHIARLTQEARAAAKLGHSAIIRVFDFGNTESGDPFIVMELLHGEDLAAALSRRGCLRESKAVQIVLPVVHALAAAHEKRIVHRDLKPANIFLARTDGALLQPKLVDFGIAKQDREGFVRLTREGALLGSPAYMSPEQARGEDVDHSADIWAVCVVLYEMVTGTLPFAGDNYNALLWAIAHDEPAPTSTHVGGDPKLWAIIKRGLRKTKHERWPDIRQLGEALAKWLCDRGVIEDIAGSSLQATWLTPQASGVDLLGKDSVAPASQGPRVALGASRTPSTFSEAAITLGEGESGAPASAKHWRWVMGGVALILLLGGIGLLRNVGQRPASTPLEARAPLALALPRTGSPAASGEHLEDRKSGADVPAAPGVHPPAPPAATAPLRRPVASRPANRPPPERQLKNPFE